MCVDIPEVSVDLKNNGFADGFVDVGDNSKFYPGATVTIWSSTQAGVECIITELYNNDKIGLRRKGGWQNTGRSDMSMFLKNEGARVNQPAQVVRIEIPHVKLGRV
ncbi:MAG: hypothetical protein EBZ49_15600 [Proteobacteria bacterium]|nr:hypothetical protein [Pseudomonadota bacterium]